MNRILVLSLLCMFLSSASFAQDSMIDPDNSKAISDFIGEVILSKGQVKKTRSGEEIVVSKRGKILVKDSIKTGKASFVKIKMLDDTVMSIGPESQFEFSKFIFRSKDDRQSVYNFIKGQVRAHFPVKSKDGDIEFKTKTTSMGIRGTTLLANVQKTDGIESAEYLLLEGKIEVNNLINNTSTIIDPGVHYILNSKEKVVQEEESTHIAPELLAELHSLSQDELSDMKPLLPFNLYKKIKQALNSKKDGRSPASIGISTDRFGQNKKVNKDSKAVKWKKTLNDLNDELKNNGPR